MVCMYVVCVDAALLGRTDAATKVRKKLKEASGDGYKKSGRDLLGSDLSVMYEVLMD